MPTVICSKWATGGVSKWKKEADSWLSGLQRTKQAQGQRRRRERWREGREREIYVPFLTGERAVAGVGEGRGVRWELASFLKNNS